MFLSSSRERAAASGRICVGDETRWHVVQTDSRRASPPGFHMLAFIRSIDVAPKHEERSHGVPGGGVDGMGVMNM